MSAVGAGAEALIALPDGGLGHDDISLESAPVRKVGFSLVTRRVAVWHRAPLSLNRPRIL
jgi:hypothetical protein